MSPRAFFSIRSMGCGFAMAKWCALASAILFSNAITTAFAQSQSAPSLPAIVQADIRKACDKPPVLKSGFVTIKDINGDGVQDYVLDYSKFQCGNDSPLYCGTAGCLTTVFASLPDRSYVKVLDENVRGIEFRKIKGRAAMILDLHGSACGRAGAARCGMTLFWNGQTFSAAN